VFLEYSKKLVQFFGQLTQWLQRSDFVFRYWRPPQEPQRAFDAIALICHENNSCVVKDAKENPPKRVLNTAI
jgi:hypothetical protein